MLLAVTGVHKLKFDDVDGTKVYGVVKDNQVKGVEGEPTASVWFPTANRVQLPDYVGPGTVLEIFFEQGKKTPAFCREYDGD